MRSTRWLLLACAGLAAIAGGCECVTLPPDAIYLCGETSDCPEGQVCAAGSCTLPDAATVRDAGAGADAASFPDAEVPPDAGEEPPDAAAPGRDASARRDAAMPPDAEAPPDAAEVPPDASLPTSCAALDGPDGGGTFRATVQPPLAPAPVEVQCLSLGDGRPWTLAARSGTTAGTNEEFGWTHPVGSLGTEGPYCLGAVKLGLTVGEVLVASQGPGGSLGDDRYWLELTSSLSPATIDKAYAASSVTDLSVAAGGCVGAPSDGASLRHVGCDKPASFLLGKTADCAQTTGLGPGGFDLGSATGCNEQGSGGNLHGKQGLLFVR